MYGICTNIIGYAAVVCGIMIMAPQVVKSWRTGKVDDLSLWTAILYLSNCILWFVYGLLICKWPMIIANGIGLPISIILLALKLKRNRRI